MKRLLIIAALTAAALVGRAQSEADSVSVMFTHLQRTNAEIARINKAYTTHAVMVAGGAAVMALGSLYAASRKIVPNMEEPQMDQQRLHTGLCIAAAGADVIISSVFVLPRGVHLDERGLVVDLQ